MQDTHKTAVIFGGAGFIGRHLASYLLTLGYQVHVADLFSSNQESVEFIKCDVREEIKLNIDRGPELVFLLSAVHRSPGHHSDEYYETNVAGATNVTNWCNAVGACKIVFTSSIAVYGPGSEPKDEFSRLTPIHAYGKSKMLSENILKSWQQEDSNARALVVCRPAVIFGPGEGGNFTRLAKALKYRMFFYPGGPSTVKSCGYVKDLVRSLVFVANQADKSELTYNFCYPESYSIGQICEAFHIVAGYARPFSLPIATIGNLLTHLPGPLSLVGARVLKLVLATKIVPTVLLNMNFVWESDLTSGLADWKVNSEKSGYFA